MRKFAITDYQRDNLSKISNVVEKSESKDKVGTTTKNIISVNNQVSLATSVWLSVQRAIHQLDQQNAEQVPDVVKPIRRINLMKEKERCMRKMWAGEKLHLSVKKNPI